MPTPKTQTVAFVLEDWPANLVIAVRTVLDRMTYYEDRTGKHDTGVSPIVELRPDRNELDFLWGAAVSKGPAADQWPDEVSCYKRAMAAIKAR